jgi:hypothetical protein
VSAAGIALRAIIADVIPFLVLAIGIDNVFQLSHLFRQQAAYLLLQTRLALTLYDVGTGITLAAASECGAFLLGANTDMPAVQAFAVISAVAIAVVWAIAGLCLLCRFGTGREEDGAGQVGPLLLCAGRGGAGRCMEEEQDTGQRKEEEADFEAQIQHHQPDPSAAAAPSSSPFGFYSSAPPSRPRLP